MPQNVDADEGSSSSPPISIFNYPGRVSGKSKTYFLDQVDVHVAHLYVLQNCPEVDALCLVCVCVCVVLHLYDCGL